MIHLILTRLFYVVCICLLLSSCGNKPGTSSAPTPKVKKENKIGKWFKIATAGFKGPVYRTDVKMLLEKVDPEGNDTIFYLAPGLRYRIVNEENGTNYIKMIPRVSYIKNSQTKRVDIISEPISSKESYRYVPTDELYKATNIESYNQILVSRITVGTMLLPIKFRRSLNFNGVSYDRQFSTDLSVGPYVGYRFKLLSKDYKTHTTSGVFAGPTLIDFVSTTDQNGSPTNIATPDVMVGFTAGIGVVHIINDFQIGIVYGADWVSGRRVNEWPYDGKGWFSLGIGYNFMSGGE